MLWDISTVSTSLFNQSPNAIWAVLAFSIHEYYSEQPWAYLLLLFHSSTYFLNRQCAYTPQPPLLENKLSLGEIPQPKSLESTDLSSRHTRIQVQAASSLTAWTRITICSHQAISLDPSMFCEFKKKKNCGFDSNTSWMISFHSFYSRERETGPSWGRDWERHNSTASPSRSFPECRGAPMCCWGSNLDQVNYLLTWWDCWIDQKYCTCSLDLALFFCQCTIHVLN